MSATCHSQQHVICRDSGLSTYLQCQHTTMSTNFYALHIVVSPLSVYTLPVQAIAYRCVTFVSIYITCSGYCISLCHFCQYIHYLFRLLHIVASLLSVYTLPVQAIAYRCVTFVSIYITCSGYCISLRHFCQYIHYILRLLPLAIFPVTYIYSKIHSILFPQT